MAFFTELKQIKKICMETQRLRIDKAILWKNSKGGRISLSDLIILQTYSNQNSRVLAQKQKYRSME